MVLRQRTSKCHKKQLRRKTATKITLEEAQQDLMKLLGGLNKSTLAFRDKLLGHKLKN